MAPLIYSFYYVYALIGMDNFNTKTFPYTDGSPYNSNDYTDFTSIGNAMLILF